MAMSSSGRSRRSATISKATDDLAFLDEPVAWRREDNFERTDRAAIRSRPISTSSSPRCASASFRERSLIRYGEGDWNDSLQPADPTMRDWMVSSWTVALLFQQLSRYAEMLRRVGRNDAAKDARRARARRCATISTAISFATAPSPATCVFSPDGGEPELLLHPSDTPHGPRTIRCCR